jgi:hypothetical protein
MTQFSGKGHNLALMDVSRDVPHIHTWIKLPNFAAGIISAVCPFFGSVLRDDFGPESDVDVLVELEPDLPFN